MPHSCISISCIFIFRVTKMLTEYIDLTPGSEHELPWFPPVCDERELELEKLQHIVVHLRETSLKMHPFLKQHFMKYVNDGKAEEAEIGQRIITAINKVSRFLCNSICIVFLIK